MRNTALISEMVDYDAGCPQRIQHFLKVYAFSKELGMLEQLPAQEQQILEAAAIVHDIGIRRSLEKYGDSDGKHQEQEGPAEAMPLLRKAGYADAECNRICWLIAHHHTYNAITERDHQILVEADFLVNLYEGQASLQAIESAYRKIFRTKSGKRLCRVQFGLLDSGH